MKYRCPPRRRGKLRVAAADPGQELASEDQEEGGSEPTPATVPALPQAGSEQAESPAEPTATVLCGESDGASGAAKRQRVTLGAASPTQQQSERSPPSPPPGAADASVASDSGAGGAAAPGGHVADEDAPAGGPPENSAASDKSSEHAAMAEAGAAAPPLSPPPPPPPPPPSPPLLPPPSPDATVASLKIDNALIAAAKLHLMPSSGRGDKALSPSSFELVALGVSRDDGWACDGRERSWRGREDSWCVNEDGGKEPDDKSWAVEGCLNHRAAGSAPSCSVV